MREREAVITEAHGWRDGRDEIMLFAEEAGLEYVPRQGRSLSKIMQEEKAEKVVVWEASGPVLHYRGMKWYYHPSMAKTRIAVARKGGYDPMLKAMDLEKGKKVLDCTLGLGSDAVVASWAVGPQGRVVGTEASRLVAAMVRWGLAKAHGYPVWLIEAMQRIEVVWADHLDYLKSQKTSSFDVVYFDPLFRCPVASSSAMAPLRVLGKGEPLSTAAIKEAIRVAKERVVIKERKGSKEFERLGVDEVFEGKSSRLAYGIIYSRSKDLSSGLGEKELMESKGEA